MLTSPFAIDPTPTGLPKNTGVFSMTAASSVKMKDPTSFDAVFRQNGVNSTEVKISDLDWSSPVVTALPEDNPIQKSTTSSSLSMAVITQIAILVGGYFLLKKLNYI